MKGIFSLFSLFCLIVTSSQLLWAAGEPAVFLQGGAGARALGMGGAFAAIADDASSIYWNPAQLGWQERFEIGAMHSDSGMGSQYDFLGMVLPVSSSGSLGGGWIRESLEDIEITNASRQSFGTTKAINNAYLLGYGQTFGDFLSLGITLKSIQEKIDTYTASAVGADIGLLLRLTPVHFTFVINDLNNPTLEGTSYWGTDVKVKETIPRKLRVGFAYTRNSVLKVGELSALYKNTHSSEDEESEETINPKNIRGIDFSPAPPSSQGSDGSTKAGSYSVPLTWKYALDVLYIPGRENSLALSPGLECWIKNTYALRFGWKLNDFSQPRAFYHNLSLGASFVLGFIHLDYAYVLHQDLKNIHYISTNLVF